MNQQLVAATVRRPRGGRCGMYFIPRVLVQKYHTQRAADCSLLLLYNLYISLHCFKLSLPRNRLIDLEMRFGFRTRMFLFPVFEGLPSTMNQPGRPAFPSGEVQAGGTRCLCPEMAGFTMDSLWICQFIASEPHLNGDNE